MAETVTIGGKKFPKTMVYAGAALTAGIVGYAWWTKGTGEDEFVEDAYISDSYGDERIPPTTIDSSQVSVDTRAGLKTNQEWYNAALDKLLYDYGVADIPTASDALNKYLAQDFLTSAQIKMINFVLNSIGIPPESGRLPLRQAPATPTTPTTPTTPSTTKPKAPTGVKVHYVGRGPRIGISWNKVSGATHYFIQRDGGPEGTQPRVNVGNVGSHTSIAQVRQPTYYGWHIWAANSAGLSSPVPTGGIVIRP